ncbi:MAG: arsinothricin resistance N-acetyltransferase ArsN1 family B [Solirubrobacteraceae bacterium]
MLRDADPSRDGAACAEIYAPFVRDTAVSFEQEPPDARQMAERIEAICAGHPWLVAEREDRVVAFAYASGHRAREAYRWTAEVSVYVDLAHRRRGLGAELYTALLELLRRQGICVVCAGITLPNEASVGLHESLGFQPVGVYRAVGWKAGEWWDVGWWQLRLREPGTGRPRELTAPQRLASR